MYRIAKTLTSASPSPSPLDLLSFLPAYLSPALLSPNRCPTELGQQTLSQLLASLLDLIVQTFSTYVSYEVSEHVYLAERLWPTWVGRVARGDVAPEDSGRMVALLKGDLAREIDNLAELRPLAGTPPAPEQRGAISDGTRSPSKMRMTMTAGTSTATTPTKVPPLPGFASPSFCFPSVTPSKRAHPGTSTGTTSTNPSLTLTLSLPLLSRYILIAAFLCSSNPSKKDLLMVATGDEDVFSARKKKKGGGTRKTPQRPGGGAKKDAVPQRLLGPKPFAVERLCAVTEAILPVELRSLARGPDMFQEVGYSPDTRAGRILRANVRTCGSIADCDAYEPPAACQDLIIRFCSGSVRLGGSSRVSLRQARRHQAEMLDVAGARAHREHWQERGLQGQRAAVGGSVSGAG